VVITLTILAGGFVAGLHAGLKYNSFPLMDGRLLPAGYAGLSPFWRNFTENIAAVQFDHRLLASVSLAAALAAAAAGWRLPRGHPVRRALAALAGLVVAQYAIGVATLLLVVPVALAVAHQAMAVLVLTASLAALHALRLPVLTLRPAS
jgi:cytochrome c oxidase assembly protein subunit 15